MSENTVAALTSVSIYAVANHSLVPKLLHPRDRRQNIRDSTRKYDRPRYLTSHRGFQVEYSSLEFNAQDRLKIYHVNP